MTFLEYVARQLMGPPQTGTYWHCPFCDSDHGSFMVRRPKAGCRVRYKCLRCDAWGDESDLIKHFYPREDYGQRVDRLATMRSEFERGAKPKSPVSPLRGRGSLTFIEGPRNDWHDVEIVWNDYRDDLDDFEVGYSFALGLLSQLAERCEKNNVSMEAIVKYWKDFDTCIFEMDQRHMEECDNPDCEAAVCRINRGLLPLTEEEIAEGTRKIKAAKQKAKVEHRRRVEKIREAMCLLKEKRLKNRRKKA